jgi:hypothetical protein
VSNRNGTAVALLILQEASMKSKKQTNANPSNAHSSGSQVRGENLRAKIIQSQEKGEDFRSKHQGTDVRTEK